MLQFSTYTEKFYPIEYISILKIFSYPFYSLNIFSIVTKIYFCH